MQLSDAQWSTISRLLDAVLELPESDRAAWIESVPDLDGDTRAVLRDLLARHAGGTSLIGTLPALMGGTGPRETAIVGPYRLVRELGHGGMGTVWLAERADGVLKRRAAVKLPHAGLYDRHFLERFGRERDILAALAHPNIATLYDAGVTDRGQPFLALEYIEGTNLNEFSDRARLDLRQRLELFLQVLGAVQYAHSHLVVHRDLKPSNILVTASGQVKLLDFGIAGLLREGQAGQTQLTQAGGRLLTPDYASPEQIGGQPVSTASDVYSLGTVLFELLTGERPYRLKRSSLGMLEEAILHGEPARPSDAAGDAEKAHARATTPKRLRGRLRGDLDAIVLKALRKDPGERYATAEAFAQDIQRYLAGEAVLARPDGAWYRARKYLSRHRFAVAAAAAVFAALAAGLSLALWQAHIARREARTAQAVQKFLEDIFRANTANQPDPVRARQTTARELLDIGARKIEASLKDAPTAKLAVLETLSGLYDELGLNERAVSLGRQWVSLARSVNGPNDPGVAQALVQLASALHASRFVNERKQVLEEASRILDRNKDYTSPLRAAVLLKLTEEYQSTDLNKALDYARQGVRVARANPRVDLVDALYEQSLIHQYRGEYSEGETLLSEAAGLLKKADGDRSFLPRLYATRGDGLMKLLRFAQAEECYRQAYGAARRFSGEEHVDTLETQLRLGYFLVNTSRTREGLKHLEDARNTALKARGAADPFYTPQTQLEYGWALAVNGRVEEGLRLILQAVENRRKNRPGTRYLAQMLEEQAYAQTELGQYAEAQRCLDEALAIRRKVGGPIDYANYKQRAHLLTATGHGAEAMRAIDSFLEQNPGAGQPSLDSLDRPASKAEAALSAGDAAQAIRLVLHAREELRANPTRAYLKGMDARLALILGRAYLAERRPAEALSLLKKAVELDTEVLDPISPVLAGADVSLAACYADLDDAAQARTLLARARAIHAAHPQLGRQYTVPLRGLQARLRAEVTAVAAR